MRSSEFNNIAVNQQYIMLFILGIIPLLIFVRSALKHIKSVISLRSKWLEYKSNNEETGEVWSNHFNTCVRGVAFFLAFWGMLAGTGAALSDMAHSMKPGSANGMILVMWFPYAMLLGMLYGAFTGFAGAVVTSTWIKKSVMLALVVSCLILVIGILLMMLSKTAF